MVPQKLFLIICFGFSLTSTPAQVKVIQHHFTFTKTDHQNCETQRMDITYPLFYSEKDKPLFAINDSVRKIILAETYINLADSFDFFFKTIIEKGIDSSFIFGDTMTLFDCDLIWLIPNESNVDFEIFLNNTHLLSFAIETSLYAGGGGNGACHEDFTFNYDLETSKWVNLQSLFPKINDTLLLQKTDSLFLTDYGADNFNDENQFTGYVGMKNGALVFYYRQGFGGKSLDQPVTLNYEEFKKQLNPHFRKILKPVRRKKSNKTPKN